MSMFDYGSSAEFFPTRRWRSGAPTFGYKRFARAADAIRFVIEELPPDLLVGAFLEVDEERFDGKGIRQLYDSADYPLKPRCRSSPARKKSARNSKSPREKFAPTATSAAH